MTQLLTIQRLVFHILKTSYQSKWTVQGLGMLRLEISNDTRIHIWHPNFVVPNVSTIHDHLQWGLESTVVFGIMTNIRFRETCHRVGQPGRMFRCARIKAGIGGGIEKELEPIRLDALDPEVYAPGETYSQEPAEIHESIPTAGTCTIVKRHRTEDKDGARVFWDHGEWVDAEPRRATCVEAAFGINYVLEHARLALGNTL